jgi:ABC-type uncharacterized transport system substrate-binding protein
MKKIIIFLSVLIITSSVFYFVYNKKKNKIIVAIFQGMSYQPYNDARDNFIKTLKNIYNDNISFLLYCSENSLSNAHIMANQMHINPNINLFFTIDSDITLALHTIEKKRPIISIAVENPQELGFIYTNSNICGITDAIPPKAVFHMLESINIKDKTIGLLYKNKQSRRDIAIGIKQELEDHNFNILQLEALDESEIPVLLNNYKDQVDIFVSPADNMIAGAMPLITSFCKKHKKPYFICFKDGALNGASASIGNNYSEEGFTAAELANDILKQKKQPCDYGFIAPSYDTIYLNQEYYKQLNIDKKYAKNIIIL